MNFTTSVNTPKVVFLGGEFPKKIVQPKFYMDDLVVHDSTMQEDSGQVSYFTLTSRIQAFYHLSSSKNQRKTKNQREGQASVRQIISQLLPREYANAGGRILG